MTSRQNTYIVSEPSLISTASTMSTPSRSRLMSSVAELPVVPMPSNTIDRMAALKDLGATFNEGDQKVAKVATPTDPEMVPSFVDAQRIEQLKTSDPEPVLGSLQDAGRAAMID